MSIKDQFRIGTEVVLKSGRSPHKSSEDGSAKTWSQVTDLADGAEGVVIGILDNGLRIKMQDPKGGMYRKGAVFTSIACAWSPR